MSHVFLIGFMGAGKSTVGPILARRLGIPFIDLDARIVERAGMPVERVFSERGEAVFRTFEREELAAVCDGVPAVVAAGGGAVIDDDNRSLMKGRGTVVLLRVSAEEALARLGDASGRPLLAGDAEDRARGLLAERIPVYAGAADIVVDTVGSDPGAVAREIESLLHGVGSHRGAM